MTQFFKALLLAGFFILGNANASGWPGNIDWAAGNMASNLSEMTVCSGSYGDAEFTIKGHGSNIDCVKEANKKYIGAYLSATNAGKECPTYIVSTIDTGFILQDQYLYTDFRGSKCASYGSGRGYSVGSDVVRYETLKTCPPDPSGVPQQDAYKKKFTVKAKFRNPDGSEGQADVCYKPMEPIACGSLKGMGTSNGDYFMTDSPDYKHPSCVTIVDKDKNGNRRAGNCQVIAKSWISNPASLNDPNFKKWEPLVGTFTGVSCAQDEQTKEPEPDKKPTCWNSTNNLKMCQADPAERCLNFNGVEKCDTGCGYINGDFWCSSKDAGKDPIPPKQDQIADAPDDTLTDPTKTNADMTKADFKEVNKGVETRISQLNTNLGNLENSVDQSNTILSEIEFNTAQNLTDNQITNTLLTDIKNGLANGSGTGGDTGTGDGGDTGGECDPKADPTCGTGGDAGNPSSWWSSVYPNGIQGIINDKKTQFQQTDAYKSMTQEIEVGSGTVQPWEFCFTSKSMNFGCFNLEIPPYVLGFIRLVMLFGAAVLCRRMLIGA